MGRQSRPGTRGRAEASYDEATRARDRGRRRGGPERPVDLDRRFGALLCLMALAAACVVVKLVWLQVVDAPDLSAEAQSQRTNVITLRARRGTIYDRNGNVLATSEDCTTVYANPKEVTDPERVADALVDALGGDRDTYLGLLTQDTTFVYLKRQADTSAADELSSELSDAGLPGVYYLDDTRRVYPYGNVGAQVIGYVGTEGTGLSGIELQYDDILTGSDGQMIVETGRTGTPIAGGASEVTPASDGSDIVLSIDIDLQESCESIISQAVETYGSDSGSVMVTDPKTGEVLAACSTPLPDFSNLTDNSSLSLKLVSSSFEPGSVFKVITTSIGLDLGLYAPDSVYSVPARYKVGDDYVTDDDGRDWTQDMTVTYMLAHSSNPAMALLVQEVIGAKAFSEGVARYGIGQLTGIDYPGEVTGIVKSLDEYDGSTAGTMAFGQALAIPMVQIVRAYGAVANDGVPLTPHFLVSADGEQRDWPAGERIISKETADAETDMMRAVMTEGTGKNGAVEGYDIAGKTGTGEQASSEGGYAKNVYVASLCGFANADDPEALVYVGLNGTAHLALSSAAHVFHDVMQQTVTIMGIEPVS